MNPKKHRRKCKNCGEECKRPQAFYCSFSCQQAYQTKQKIVAWEKGEWNGMTGIKVITLSKIIRQELLRRVDFKCEECGWNKINPYTSKISLEIHHKDGIYLNNKPDNLIVLCPNCHSLTGNYKARGNGRPYRNKKGKA